MALTLHGTVLDNTVALDRKTATPLIINGDMAISQRGTSLSSQSSSTRLLDRFANDIGGGGAITISQDTDTPNSTFPNSMKMVVATADSSIAAADAYRFTYTVEGKDIATVGLGNSDCQTMTLTFWVRSSVTGTYGIGFQNSAETENYVDEYAISSANTWEKKVINIPVRTSGTWLTTNGVGLGIRWDLGSGTNYNGTADTWQTTSGKVYRTSSCVNWIATASATFYVTGVQLEIGTFDANSIPDFQHEDVATSLARCQRYFVTTYNEGVVPGTNGSKHGAIFVYRQRDNNYAGFNFQFPVGMRTIPAQVRYSLDGTSGQATASTTNFTSSTNHAINGTSSVIAYGTGTAADDCYQHFTCDAEL